MVAKIVVLPGVAQLAAVEVGAIADLVLGDPHQPAEQRAAVLPLEIVEVLERLEEGRLQDVARLEAGPQAPPHLQPDEREQAGTEPLVEGVERRVGARERLAQHRGAGRAVHRSVTLPRVRFRPALPSLLAGGVMRMISMVCGVLVTAVLCSGCLRKEVAETIYISPSGVVWSVVERDVRSDKEAPKDRTLEERDYVLAADTETHGVAQAFRQLGALSITTTWLRRERPYSVMTEARFGDLRQMAMAILRDTDAKGEATLVRDGCRTIFNLRDAPGRVARIGQRPGHRRACDRSQQLSVRAHRGTVRVGRRADDSRRGRGRGARSEEDRGRRTAHSCTRMGG